MRTKKGQVVQNATDKTVKVEVHTYKSHPKYKKRYRVTKKYLAHDPENKCEIGENIVIYESRPISKRKRWTTVAPNEKVEVKETKSEEEIINET